MPIPKNICAKTRNMDDLFQNTARAPDFTKHGAVRHRNGVQQRNCHGFYQYRETNKDNWMFVIYAFGDTDCSVYKVENEDDLCLAIVPIDSHNRITICGRKYGRKYGREHWHH